MHVVPAVAQHNAQSIVTRPEPRRDVICRIQDALVIDGEGRVENVITHLVAVDPQFVVPEAADVHAGRRDGFVQLERLAEDRARMLLPPTRQDAAPPMVDIDQRLRRHPCRVVEPGLGPPVVHLVGNPPRARHCHLPGVPVPQPAAGTIGHDDRILDPAFRSNHQFRDDTGQTHGGVAGFDRQNVLPGHEQRRHVARPGRCRAVRIAVVPAGRLPVHVQNKLVMDLKHQAGPADLHRLGKSEGSPEVPCARGHFRLIVTEIPLRHLGEPDPLASVKRQGLLRVHRFRAAAGRFGVPHPRCLPVLRPEQPHGPHGRPAPFRSGAVPIPDPDFPIARLAGDECLTLVDNADGPIGFDLTGVPEIALPGCEQRLTAGDQDPVGGLRLAALVRLDNPAQARTGRVDAEGIDEVFAP